MNDNDVKVTLSLREVETLLTGNAELAIVKRVVERTDKYPRNELADTLKAILNITEA